MGPILNNYGSIRACISLKRTPVNGASHETFTPNTTLTKLRFCHSEACDVSISEAFLWHSNLAIHNGAMMFLAAEGEIFKYLLLSQACVNYKQFHDVKYR